MAGDDQSERVFRSCLRMSRFAEYAAEYQLIYRWRRTLASTTLAYRIVPLHSVFLCARIGSEVQSVYTQRRAHPKKTSTG